MRSAWSLRIVGEVADGVVEDVELAALEDDPVEEDRGEDDPADGEQAERGA